MRSTGDRIRHALSFEIIALVLITPLAAWAFALPMADSGVVAVGSAVIATVWTYFFNLGFDHALKRITGSVAKGFVVRVVHAVTFEAGLIAILMPPIAWYLDVSLLQAFLLDASVTVFYVAYAFAFNLAYDRVFPIPDGRLKAGREKAS
ncbi:MAG: PACE efflux transporter [Oricola sp.]